MHGMVVGVNRRSRDLANLSERRRDTQYAARQKFRQFRSSGLVTPRSVASDCVAPARYAVEALGAGPHARTLGNGSAPGVICRRWDTSLWSRPRSIPKSPSSAPAASPNYLAPPGSQIIRCKTRREIRLLHAGRNFQKQFAPTRMRTNLACYKTAAHEKCPSNIIRGMSDIT